MNVKLFFSIIILITLPGCNNNIEKTKKVSIGMSISDVKNLMAELTTQSKVILIQAKLCLFTKHLF